MAQTGRLAGQGFEASTDPRPGGLLAEPPRRPNDSPDQLVARAVVAVTEHPAIAADLSCCTELFGRRLQGTGRYFQERSGGRGHLHPELAIRFRLELRTKMLSSGAETTLLAVGNDRDVWTVRETSPQEALERGDGSNPAPSGGEPASRTTVTHVDVGRVAAALESRPEILASGKLAGGLRLGGLPQLLHGLAGSFAFESAEATDLTGVRAWRLVGRWRPERLAQLLPESANLIQQGQSLALEKLPPHVPEYVVLYLDRSDLFPYRVEYRRRDAEAAADEADRAIMILDFSHVGFQTRLADEQYTYKPTVSPADETAGLLKALGIPER